MPSTVLIAVAAVSLSLPLLLWAAFARPDRARVRTAANLHRGFRTGAGDDPQALTETVGVLSRLAPHLTPRPLVLLLDRLLGRAGRPSAWPLERLLVIKPVLAVAIAGVSLLYVSSVPGPLPVLMALMITLVGYFLPELLLYSRGKERSQKIRLELADTLDQMTIAVEAGLGFDAAMARAGKNGNGPLAEELVRTLQDIQVGHSRRRAYESLAERTDVIDLRRFVRAIIQADNFGIAIADVLRTQASEMRMKRRQRAEEKAMQIPVKVIFPLMLCILPVLFIVLLGPAVMDIVKAFS